MKKETCPMPKDAIVFDLNKGLEAEYRAMELCEKLMPFLDNESDKKEINEIIADEKGHIEITNKLIEIVNKYYTAQIK